MKPKSSFRSFLRIAVGTLLTISYAQALDGTWNATAAGPFNWSDTTRWVDSDMDTFGDVADGTGFTAFFTPNITAAQTVTVDSARTIGNITFTDSTTSSHNLTIGGANTLTLDVSSGASLIDVTQSGRTLTISAPVTVNDGLQKNGAGTLTITGATTLGGSQTWTNNTATALGFKNLDLGTGTLTFSGSGNFSGDTGTIAATAGSIVHDGSGLVMLGRTAGSLSYTGTTTISGGGTLMIDDSKPTGNFNISNGFLTDYFQTTHAFTSGLGTGDNQIQITGSSGLGAGNGTSTWRIGATGSTLVWGASGEGTATGHFNPTEFKLRSPQGDNNGGSIWGNPNLDNRLDLNSGSRTIRVHLGSGNIGASRASIDDGIQDTGALGSLTLTGGGMLIINGTTSTWGGNTNINAGILFLGGNNENNIGGGSARNITIASGAGIQFTALSNAVLNRIVETTNEIAVMTGTTSNNLDFLNTGTGANLPNAFLGNYATNGAKAEISGTITPGSNGYRLGATGSAGLLGIVGTNKITGTSGLTVGGTGGGGIRVELAAANDFTGNTVINTGARLGVGNNLALQNSALDVGSAGGNISFSTGVVTAKITGSSRSDSPTFGGLIGSRNLATVFSNGASNNEQSLQSYQMLGFTLNTGAAANHTYSGIIANFARDTAVTKTGIGTQEFSGASTYSGITTINDGTLKIGNASALGKGGSAGASTGSTVVNSGGTLDLNGTSGVVEPLVLNGTGIGGNGALVNNSGTAAGISSGLASIQVTSGGVYSAPAPTVTINGVGTGAAATATLGVTNASITSISGGTGWAVGDQFTLTGGGGSGAVVTVTSVSTGAITGYDVTHAGSGYTGAPTGITRIVGNSTANPTISFNASNFTVSGLTLTNAGSGYDNTTTVSFSAGAATAAVQYSAVTLASDTSIGGSGDITIDAVVSESGGARALTKLGAGTLTLTGVNTYTGDTTVSGGILRITKPYLDNASDVVIGASGQLDLQFDESGGDVTDAVNTLTIGGVQQPAGIYGATGSGATTINDARFAGVGTLTVLTGPGGPTGFAAWQAANSTAGTRDQDHDNDGVDNGTEHFLGGDTNTTGFTALPTVVNTAGTLSVTWTRHPNYPGFPGNYGTDVVVETSATLAGPWTPETGGNVTITGNDVKYTFPGGPAYTGKNFARLKVTGP